MKLPRPQEKLAGCVWLPRILAKARLLQAGGLPPDYVANFCHPQRIDGLFLTHFDLTREDLIAAAAMDDGRVAEWFLARANAERIEQWNHTAMNLGRPGYPLADRLPVVLATVYKNVAGRGLKTVFEVIEADDQES